VPLYQYSCELCHYEFEAFQRMDEEVFFTCPKCTHRSLRRIIGTPAIRTAKTFAKGRGTLLEQFGGDEAEVKRVTDEAKKQGYTPRDCDSYEPGLARCKGDPEAFIPPSDPIGHVKRICAKHGISCEGRGLTIKAPPRESPPTGRSFRGHNIKKRT
jgi:putative FmdB family regulatory protein